MFRSFFKMASGRSTGFAIFFAINGTVLQWFHRLDTTYITLAATILTLVIGHSVKEDLITKPAVVQGQ